ncbi:TIR domain-containing protein [Photobacterium profundum]|uniref:Thoeris protein ThsB TIR-like domain-containing protein n=1 Tax=Photobacterium profundum (strain SS9) TaxID=298386 RepID=Q6LJM5_PHOPR|nr:TIR domain-containing protein [Photobacterium profundum]CAG22505.1 hypothetical protein PBPRB0632 [Photobacterium profundum SS9]
MKRIFISHNHRDSKTINLIKSIYCNPNHNLNFANKSLAAPIFNDHQHINRRPPTDSASKPVKQEISRLLNESDKLLVLIGPDTHSSLWVQWEINAFTSKHSSSNILMMRIPDNQTAGAPANARHLSIHNWDLKLLTQWVK